jgi:hypothetical protein
MNLHNWLKYRQNNQGNNTKTEQKWVTFTHVGNYIHKITKLFKNTNSKIATIGKLLGDTCTTNTYEQSGIYKITCQNCHEVYWAKGLKLNNMMQRTHKKHKVQ